MAPSILIRDSIPPMDARISSSIAHASILLPGIGILVPVILWSNRKKYSHFARIQILQVLIFQLFQWIWIQLLSLVFFFVVFIYASISTASHLTPEIYSNRMLTALIASIIVIAIGWFFYLVFGMIGAAVCLSGRNYQYPWLGRWIDKYVSRNQDISSAPDQGGVSQIDSVSSNEGSVDTSSFSDREDKLIASLSHAAILIPIVGLLVPFLLVTMDKEKSQQNRFQVMQSLIFQLLGQVINFVLFGCQLVMVFSLGIPMVQMNLDGQFLMNEPVMLGFGLIIIFLLFIDFFILLVTPLLGTLGIIASVQVLRGKEYHYPILGKMLAKRMGT